jgi:hypothetical protein
MGGSEMNNFMEAAVVTDFSKPLEITVLRTVGMDGRRSMISMTFFRHPRGRDKWSATLAST